MKKLNVYVAGKVSKDSVFGTTHWREKFIDELRQLSGLDLYNLDPTKISVNQSNPDKVFGADAALIKQCDLLIVYLSDDISVGGSQEILIAKYFRKPVIGLAPVGGKFNGCVKHIGDTVISDYKDPFVYATCDVVVGSVEEAARALRDIDNIEPKGIDLIDRLVSVS